MTCLVRDGSVTVPVRRSMVPDEVAAMLPTNDGSWKSTGPDGAWPSRVNDTDRPSDEILIPSLWPSVVGKLVTETVRPRRNQVARGSTASVCSTGSPRGAGRQRACWRGGTAVRVND